MITRIKDAHNYERKPNDPFAGERADSEQIVESRKARITKFSKKKSESLAGRKSRRGKKINYYIIFSK